jgi:hypothetical protein
MHALRASRPRALLLVLLAAVALSLTACCAAWVSALPGGASGARALRLPGGGDADVDEAAAAARAKAATRAALGRATWELLHRLAAKFDAAPTPARVAEVTRFFSALSTLYPCDECAAHLREMLAARPVDARDNKALSLWLCATHNDVNARLGKPAFPCTLDKIKERWGECGCFGNATGATAAAAPA